MKTDDEVKIVGRLKELAIMASSMAGIKPGTPVKEEDEITQVENYLREIAVNLDFQKRQQTALYAATKVLAEAEDVGVAMPHILQAICEALHWQWAAMWTVDADADVLRCNISWKDANTPLDEFSKLTHNTIFTKGEGLIGQVWATGKATWVTDVQRYYNFKRLVAAQQVGLHAALCFPVYSLHGLLGVMEFLTIKAEEPDNSLLMMMNAVGSQIGQFIEPKLAQALSAKKIAELEAIQKNLEHDFASRMRDGLRLKAQHAATKVLADAPSLAEATPQLLKAICEGLNWQCSMMWEVNESGNELQFLECWHADDGDFTEFIDMSRNMGFMRGRGLPGRVWDMGEPLWILDVVKDTNFPRAKAAEKVDLHGAFAFPVKLKDHVLGVMEFFSRQVQEPDDALLAMMAAVGSQIGQFIERKNAEAKATVYLQEVEKQKSLVEEHQKEIIDSINYAQRIQRALLASEDMLNAKFNDYFILFEPKDIVSGDFYWAAELENKQVALVTADSTGHGVPGAIMSMLNISCLNDAVEGQKLTSPSDILNHTRSKIIKHLANDGSAEGGKDGMDCSLISFDFDNHKLTYSAANNPVWIVRENQLQEFEPDKMPVGKHDRDGVSFKQQTIDLQKEDVVYTLTDGLPDQFGGPKGKKFMYKQLKELLVSISNLPMLKQKELLHTTLQNWKHGFDQIDDICLIGVRV